MSSKPQTIEQLRQRFDTLRDKRTTAQANLRTAEEQLAKLQAEAREKYGTDDPTELQNLLAKIRAENEEKRAAYQQHLDKIDADLKSLETGA
jgi:hypothetical protein